MLRKPGVMLCLVLGLLQTSCRTSVPPKIENCINDGVGGGDCVEVDGSQRYRTPSEMKDMWSTNQADLANWAAWCYQADTALVKQSMKELERKTKHE